MKKYIISLVALVLATSCAKLNDDAAPTKAVEFKVVSSLESNKVYDQTPDSVAIYFIPEASEISWEAPGVFSKSDTTEQKLYSISREVAESGLGIDNITSAQFYKREEQKVIDLKMAEIVKEAGLEFTCAVLVLLPDTDAEIKAKCQEQMDLREVISTELKALDDKFNANLESIQMALDGRTNDTKNWIVSETKDCGLELSENNTKVDRLKLKANFIVGQERFYDSNTGDITDLRLEKSLNGKLVSLNFTIKEKRIPLGYNPRDPEYNEAVYTGNIYKASLNRSYIIDGNGMRFLGKIKMYHEDRPDVLIREGKMKLIHLIEEVVEDEDDSDDDGDDDDWGDDDGDDDDWGEDDDSDDSEDDDFDF